jgi:hypothetical protein
MMEEESLLPPNRFTSRLFLTQASETTWSSWPEPHTQKKVVRLISQFHFRTSFRALRTVKQWIEKAIP